MSHDGFLSACRFSVKVKRRFEERSEVKDIVDLGRLSARLKFRVCAYPRVNMLREGVLEGRSNQGQWRPPAKPPGKEHPIGRHLGTLGAMCTKSSERSFVTGSVHGCLDGDARAAQNMVLQRSVHQQSASIDMDREHG